MKHLAIPPPNFQGYEIQARVSGNGNYISTPDAAGLEIPGDFTIDWYGSIDTVGAAAQSMFNKWFGSGTGKSWYLRQGTTQLETFLSNDGTAQSTPVTGTSIPAATNVGVRFTRRLSDGLSRLYTTTNDPPAWTKVGEATVSAGVGQFDNASVITAMGGHSNGGSSSPTGYFRRGEVRNGFDGAGTLLMSPDVRLLIPSATSFTDAQGNVWTMNGSCPLSYRLAPTAAPSNGAVAFAGGQKYTRSAAGLTGTELTYCAWIKMNTDTGTYSPVMASDDGGSNYFYFGGTSNGHTYGRDCSGGASGSGYDFVAGQWTFICTRFTTTTNDGIHYMLPGDSSLRGFAAGDVSNTGHLGTNTFGIAGWGFGQTSKMSIAACKIWTAWLTDAEVIAEFSKYSPVRTSGLWANYTFKSGPQTNDESGNGRTLTLTGSPTLDSSGPPIT